VDIQVYQQGALKQEDIVGLGAPCPGDFSTLHLDIIYRSKGRFYAQRAEAGNGGITQCAIKPQDIARGNIFPRKELPAQGIFSKIDGPSPGYAAINMDRSLTAVVLADLLFYALMEAHKATMGLKLQEPEGVGNNSSCPRLKDCLIQTHVFRCTSLARIQQAPALHTVTHYEIAIPI
jgi:hypothetical protein